MTAKTHPRLAPGGGRRLSLVLVASTLRVGPPVDTPRADETCCSARERRGVSSSLSRSSPMCALSSSSSPDFAPLAPSSRPQNTYPPGAAAVNNKASGGSPPPTSAEPPPTPSSSSSSTGGANLIRLRIFPGWEVQFSPSVGVVRSSRSSRRSPGNAQKRLSALAAATALEAKQPHVPARVLLPERPEPRLPGWPTLR